jgi:glutathione S-transferase
VILGLLKHPYQTREISIFEGQGQTDAYLRINPTGSVPAIQLEDGRTIAESNAILAFLAQGSAYLPSDAYSRAKVDQWLFFEQYNIEPVIGSLRFWTLTGRLKGNAAMVEGKKAAGLKALSALERRLADRDFLVGDVLSIADIAVYAYTHLAGDAGFELANYSALTDWLERVAGLIGPGFPVYPYSVDPHSYVVV